ncbi:MAG TPA: N-acetylmuramoyl-L-alanine amidase [Actinomycetota bacterium]|nr:N-acetylmuramoyl-L-alanine amidase [Actinomycetota bacterium]
MSSRRRARSVVVGLAVVGLTLVSWLPAPLPGLTHVRPVPPTVAKEVRVDLRSPQEARIAGEAGPTRSPHPSGTNRSRLGSVCAPINFTAMALTWDQRGKGEVHALVRVGPDNTRFGTATEVESAPGEGPDATSREYKGSRQATGLLWVGKGRCSKFTLHPPKGVGLSNVRAVFINTSGTASSNRGTSERSDAPASDQASPRPTSSPAAGLFGPKPAIAMTSRPSIIRRSEWGANERLRNCGASYASSLKVSFVHHTVNSNSYSPSQSDDIVRGIYHYHTQTRGYCDIAYNFLVDRYGQVFEGRAGGMTRPVIPAATMGFNTGSTAVSAIGNFESASPPSAMVSAIERLLAWRLDVAHINPLGSVTLRSTGSTGGKYPAGRMVTFRRISSHRDAGYTACPGRYLYANVPGIRSDTYSMGLPKIFNPRQSRSSFVPVRESVRWTAQGSSTLNWTLRVVNSKSEVVRSLTATASSFSRTWSGTGKDGKPVPAGTYRVRLGATKNGTAARSASFRLTIRSA